MLNGQLSSFKDDFNAQLVKEIKTREEEVTERLKGNFEEILNDERKSMEAQIQKIKEDSINNAILSTTCINGEQAISSGIQLINQLELKVAELEGLLQEKDECILNIKQEHNNKEKIFQDQIAVLERQIQIKDEFLTDNEKRNRIEHQDSIEMLESEYIKQVEQLVYV